MRRFEITVTEHQPQARRDLNEPDRGVFQCVDAPSGFSQCVPGEPGFSQCVPGDPAGFSQCVPGDPAGFSQCVPFSPPADAPRRAVESAMEELSPLS